MSPPDAIRSPEAVPIRRVLFQAPNTVGLGHISRLAAIAVALRGLDPDAAVLFAVEGDDHGLLAASGLPRVSIPGLDMLSDAWAMWPQAEQSRLAAGLAESFVAAVRPDVVVFDCLPNWAFLEVVRRHGVPYAVCVRKMKSEPLAQLLNQVRGADLVLVPHNPAEVRVPDGVTSRVRFVGRIVRPTVATSAPRPSARVVVTGGGGGYPGTVGFYNDALAALEICRAEDPTLSALLVTGPLFKDWHQLRPTPGTRIVPFEPDLARSFAEADVVVCQAGYNTVAEIASLGVNAICVPAERILDDQHERARETAARNDRFRVLADADPARLADLLRQALGSAEPRAPRPPAADGAVAAARALIEVMDAAGRAGAPIAGDRVRR